MSMRFARIRHDSVPRNNGLQVYPETVPMNNLPKGGKGEAIPYVNGWEEWTRKLNSTQSAGWLFDIGSMLFNINSTNPYKAESISNGGNVVRIIGENALFAKISHFRNDRTPPEGVTFFKRPWVVEKVVCIDRDSLALRKPASGYDVYFPLLSKGESELWIPKSQLEFFPTLPFNTSITVFETRIYKQPSTSSKFIGSARLGLPVTIAEYAPRGSDVWGMIDEGLWIRIQENTSFTTTWTMKTQPPLV